IQGIPTADSNGVVTVDNSIVTAVFPVVAVGATATLTIIVTPSAPGTITDTASVTLGTDQNPAEQVDTDPTDNTATLDTAVSPADVGVTIVGVPNPVAVGGTLMYTLTVVNNGPADATGVVVKDTLPLGVSFVEATSSGGITPTVSNGVVTANIGTLAAQG